MLIIAAICSFTRFCRTKTSYLVIGKALLRAAMALGLPHVCQSNRVSGGISPFISTAVSPRQAEIILEKLTDYYYCPNLSPFLPQKPEMKFDFTVIVTPGIFDANSCF